jgi:hypothetical protein
LLQRGGDRFTYGFALSKHVVVPETKNFDAAPLKPGVAPCVAICFACVLTSVNFDDQLRFQANKIQNVRADGELPSKLESVHLPHAQKPPQPALRVGHVLS